MPTRLHLPATDITQSLVKDSDVYVCTTMQIGKRISLMNPRVRQVPVSLTNMIPTYSCLEQDKMPLSLMMSKVQFPIFSHSLLTKAAIRATLIRQHSGQLVAAKSLEWELAPVFYLNIPLNFLCCLVFTFREQKQRRKNLLKGLSGNGIFLLLLQEQTLVILTASSRTPLIFNKWNI